jgi:hypothetical protein
LWGNIDSILNSVLECRHDVRSIQPIAWVFGIIGQDDESFASG